MAKGAYTTETTLSSIVWKNMQIIMRLSLVARSMYSWVWSDVDQWSWFDVLSFSQTISRKSCHCSDLRHRVCAVHPTRHRLMIFVIHVSMTVHGPGAQHIVKTGECVMVPVPRSDETFSANFNLVPLYMGLGGVT